MRTLVISFYNQSSDQTIKKNRIYKIIKKNKTLFFCLCDESWNQSMKRSIAPKGLWGHVVLPNEWNVAVFLDCKIWSTFYWYNITLLASLACHWTIGDSIFMKGRSSHEHSEIKPWCLMIVIYCSENSKPYKFIIGTSNHTDLGSMVMMIYIVN